VLSADARTLVRTVIRSVWALEVLKCLRAALDRSWTPDALRVELRASAVAIQQALAAFRAAGLVSDEPGGVVRYQPANPGLDALAAEVMAEYDRRPIGLIEEIYVSETSKVQDFADAFRIKKDDE
jgi:hypothetical protein